MRPLHARRAAPQSRLGRPQSHPKDPFGPNGALFGHSALSRAEPSRKASDCFHAPSTPPMGPDLSVLLAAPAASASSLQSCIRARTAKIELRSDRLTSLNRAPCKRSAATETTTNLVRITSPAAVVVTGPLGAGDTAIRSSPHRLLLLAAIVFAAIAHQSEAALISPEEHLPPESHRHSQHQQPQPQRRRAPNGGDTPEGKCSGAPFACANLIRQSTV